MREILFRGKDENTGEWRIGDLIHEEYEGQQRVGILRKGARSADGVDPATVGQYTGMEDKNGTPVYEGDFLSATLVSGRQYEVKFKDGGFYLEGTALPFRIAGHMLVVGNIFDNPEIVERG